MRTRDARLLGAVALGACLLLACCSGGAATRVPPAGPPPAAPVQVLSTPALAAAPPVRIRISAIGVDSALIALGLAADGTLQVPVDGSVAGWFTGSPTPGEHGPAVIAAHVDWNHAPGVFFHLRDLEPGAEVAVDRADGTTARFEVLEVEQYPKDAFPTERVYGDIDHAGLRLITCGGSFDRAARSYRDNVVVYAGLVGPGLIDVRAAKTARLQFLSPACRSSACRVSRISPATVPGLPSSSCQVNRSGSHPARTSAFVFATSSAREPDSCVDVPGPAVHLHGPAFSSGNARSTRLARTRCPSTASRDAGVADDAHQQPLGGGVGATRPRPRAAAGWTIHCRCRMLRQYAR